MNGCGKSTLLTAIGYREVPIPEHMDIYHLTREIDATDMTALEAVTNVDEERLKLEKEAEKLAAQVSFFIFTSLQGPSWLFSTTEYTEQSLSYIFTW